MAHDETIIREVTAGVWTFSRPFARFGFIPFGGRSTAIQLESGGVWILASTPLDDPTKAKIKELGEVKYIMAADSGHYLFISDFKKEFPGAKVIVVDPLHEKLKGKVEIAGTYGIDDPHTEYGFESEIGACYFSGFLNHDVAFHHRASKTLIEADLLFNLPGHEQYSKSSSFLGHLGLFNILSPGSSTHHSMTNSLAKDKEAMKRDAKIVAAWDFERIIPCHGDVIEVHGKKAWTDTYKDFLA